MTESEPADYRAIRGSARTTTCRSRPVVIPPESLDGRHSLGYAAGDRQQAAPLVLPWIHLPLLQKQRGDSVGITTLNPLTEGAERLKGPAQTCRRVVRVLGPVTVIVGNGGAL